MVFKNYVIKHQEKIFPVLDVALNGLNYFFHIYCSWYLSQRNYGVLNSLLSILAIMLVTGISFQTFTAKEIAANGVKINKIFQAALLYFFTIDILYFAFLKKLLIITEASRISLIIILSAFILNLFLSISRGVFQGKKEFFNLNISFYLEVVSKIIFLVVLLPLFKSVEAILLSITLGMLVSIIHGIAKLGINKRSKIIREKNLGPVIRQTGIIFASNFFIYYFTSIDMIIVNYFLGKEAGIYAVVLRYSQIVLFVSFSLMTIFIPNLSSARYSKDEFHQKVQKYFFLLLGIQVLMMVAYYTVFPFTVKYLFGIDYIGASHYLTRGAFMYVMLVNSFFMVNVNIILERGKYLILLFIGALSLTILLFKFSFGIVQVLDIGTGVYTILFATLGLLYLFERRKVYEKVI
ncbi:oligosaccharide flippase family protein [uncultured Ilyobacter sp.]|uniref:oligosaccharide flippase family protein n=1 Tax=uncultured Ilyobacter sp. TaxID=544433 RepID=UPI002AA82C49|nr:oligosaccharide flippase family protein [uncultured Ilyobacter sp.]